MPADTEELTRASAEAPAGAQAGAGAEVRRRLAALVTRRGLVAAGVILGAGSLYWLLCWILSSAAASGSDTANIALQGWDLWHHNPKLRHWITGDANFYTFETVLYAVLERIMGLGATTMHVVSGLTYTLVMLVTAWLVRGDERGARAYCRFGLVAAFLAFPMFEGDLAPTLLEAPDHIGTAVFILGAYLLCDRAAGRRWATWCLFALLVLGQLGDATVKYVGVLPVVLVCASRPLFARRLITPDLWMAVAAAASVPAQATLRAALRTWGAYSMVPPKTRLADSHLWLGHLHSTLISLLTLFDIPTSTPTRPLWPIAAVLGAFVLLAGLYGAVRTLLSWPRAAAADQLLTVGVPTYLAAFAFSTMVLPGAGSAYEFLGVIPMIVALAARNLPLPAARRLPVLAAASGLVAVAVFATDFRPAGIAPQETVAAWLKAHGYKYGIAGYWDASSTTVDSGNAVGVRAVVQTQKHQYAVYAWVTKTSWYDPAHNYADFFVANPGTPGLREADVEAAYGQPEAVYRVAGRDIMVYRTNLLADLIQAKAPNF
ncbi:hypothetical protein KGA66_08500 [Actinocrinis puniceicyclus]|uniref:Uncharacterized protein n=1 Tax=Actinocrinis puniceicyclus TaxID=977794 RepID=A0A8J8BCF9_9ACTN|nr:hypothetical protein [Actinocrinis puniceicyclus]MBS2963081.1 hypothetical protein [Actinocrinis puniceicyclus]